MRIFVFSQHALPEPPPIAHMVDEFTRRLTGRGHEVHLFTGFPSYPTGKVFGGYKRRPFQYDVVNGVHIHRLWTTSYGTSFLKRTLFFLSFAVAVKIYCRKLARPDVIYTEIPPPTSAEATITMGKHFKCATAARVQDLHPDSAIASGFVRNPLLVRYLRRQERWVYNNLDKIVVIGEGFKRALEEKGIGNGKVSICPNWINVDEVRPKSTSPNPVRQRFAIPANKRVVLYAGTMGRSHGAGILLDVAGELQSRSHMESVLFVLVGRGQDRPAIERRVLEQKLENVLVIDPVQREDLSDMLSMADLTLVSLKPGYSNFSVPSKLLGYMAAGRPVLALVDEDSDTARIVREAKCGEVLKPGDSQGVVEAVTNWLNDQDLCQRAGRAGREYCTEYLSSGVLLDRLAAELEWMGR